MTNTITLKHDNIAERELSKPLAFYAKPHESFKLLGKDSIPDLFAPFSHYVVTSEFFRYDFIALNSYEALQYFVKSGGKVNSLTHVYLMDYNFSQEVIEQEVKYK